VLISGLLRLASSSIGVWPLSLPLGQALIAPEHSAQSVPPTSSARASLRELLDAVVAGSDATVAEFDTVFGERA
jgi:hypothetical protein